DGAVLQAILSQTEITRSLLERVTSAPAPVAPPQMFDPMAMMTAMMGMMVQMKQFLGEPAKAVDPTSLIFKGIELASALKDDGREKSTLEVIGDILTQSGVLTQIAGQTQTQPGLLPPPQPIQGQPVPQRQTPQPAQPNSQA